MTRQKLPPAAARGRSCRVLVILTLCFPCAFPPPHIGTRLAKHATGRSFAVGCLRCFSLPGPPPQARSTSFHRSTSLSPRRGQPAPASTRARRAIPPVHPPPHPPRPWRPAP